MAVKRFIVYAAEVTDRVKHSILQLYGRERFIIAVLRCNNEKEKYLWFERLN